MAATAACARRREPVAVTDVLRGGPPGPASSTWPPTGAAGSTGREQGGSRTHRRPAPETVTTARACDDTPRPGPPRRRPQCRTARPRGRFSLAHRRRCRHPRRSASRATRAPVASRRVRRSGGHHAERRRATPWPRRPRPDGCRGPGRCLGVVGRARIVGCADDAISRRRPATTIDEASAHVASRTPAVTWRSRGHRTDSPELAADC